MAGAPDCARSAAGYAQGTETRQDTFEERRAVLPRAPPVAIERGFRLEDQTVGVEFTAVQAIAAGNVSHTFVYGFESGDSRIEERRDGQQTNLSSGSVTSVILGESFPLRDFPVTDVTRIGAFVQDEVQLGPSGWPLIPALRFDYYELDPRPDAMYREDNPTTEAVGLDDTAVAPKLGVTVAWVTGSRRSRSTCAASNTNHPSAAMAALAARTCFPWRS